MPTLRPAAAALRHRAVRRYLSTSLKRRHLPADGLALPDFVQGARLPHATHLTHTPAARAGATFYIETFGCQMNVADTDIVRSILLGAGHSEVIQAEDATFVFTNTCAIRENAEDKIWHRLRFFRSLHRGSKRAAASSSQPERRKPPSIGLLGCMAERLKSSLLQTGLVDLVAGPDAYRDLPRLMDVVAGGSGSGSGSSGGSNGSDGTEAAINVKLSICETYSDIVPVRGEADALSRVSAFVSIQRGCNNLCSYCIVPFTRGRERSLPALSVVEEVRRLRDSGVKEVTLLGQNVNSYHDRSSAAVAMFPSAGYSASSAGFSNMDKSRGGAGAYFAELLHMVADVDEELRVRFTSPHPKDFPLAVLEAVASRHNIAKHLHLPAQSGSSEVLRRMRRGYTVEAYMELVERARSIIPDVAISSDFIAGFCGETEADHKATLKLMRDVGYDQAYMFAYSLRDRTKAARDYQDDVPGPVKARRLQEVISTFRSTVSARNDSLEVGRRRVVLVEGASRRSDAAAPQLTGRTDGNKRVVFGETPVAADECALQAEGGRAPQVGLKAGDYAVVEITEANGHTLRGVAVARTSMREQQLLQVPPAAAAVAVA